MIASQQRKIFSKLWKKKTLTNTFSKHQRESSHWSGSSLLSWWSRMRSQNMSDMASRTFALLLKNTLKNIQIWKIIARENDFIVMQTHLVVYALAETFVLPPFKFRKRYYIFLKSLKLYENIKTFCAFTDLMNFMKLRWSQDRKETTLQL